MQQKNIKSPDEYAWNPIKPLFDLKSELGGTLVGHLIGQKTCFYNVTDESGKITDVVMETWVDTGSVGLSKPDLSKQNWRLFGVSKDNGNNWPDSKSQGYVKGCHAINKGMMITWGGPVVTTRLDESTKRFFLVSVREITPPASAS